MKPFLEIVRAAAADEEHPGRAGCCLRRQGFAAGRSGGFQNFLREGEAAGEGEKKGGKTEGEAHGGSFVAPVREVTPALPDSSRKHIARAAAATRHPWRGALQRARQRESHEGNAFFPLVASCFRGFLLLPFSQAATGDYGFLGLVPAGLGVASGRSAEALDLFLFSAVMTSVVKS